jgi:hypothetical protein
MSIQSEIDRINNAKSEIAEAISEKGVAVAEGTSIDDFAPLIASIETGGPSVQSDYAQNDSTQPDYIKNRPFYRSEGYSYEWDGTAPDETKKVGGDQYYFYKISDKTMAISDLVGATANTNTGHTLPITESSIKTYENGSFAYRYSSYELIFVCVEAGSFSTILGTVELTPGLWLLNGGFYVAELEKGAGIKQIDNEFIVKATAIDDANADLPVTAGLFKTELEKYGGSDSGSDGDLVMISGIVDLSTMSVVSMSHTYAEIKAMLEAKKMVFVETNYGLGYAYGQITSDNLQYNNLFFQVMLQNDFGDGMKLYYLAVKVSSSDDITLTPYIINTTAIGG